jgi:signal transduction histidine kinase
MPVPEMRRIAVEEMMREVLKINPPGGRIEVPLECPFGLPCALGDLDQIRMALGNLVRNAPDTIPHGVP